MNKKQGSRKNVGFALAIIGGLILGFFIKRVTLGLVLGLLLGLLASGLAGYGDKGKR
jgi:uncharacterized membrane protein (UPF0136 family)